MKSGSGILALVSLAALSSYSQVALATWSCEASCEGSSKTILDTLQSGSSAGDVADFRVNCEQNLGGYNTTHSQVYCGSYYVCEKLESSPFQVAGSGTSQIEARRTTRASCQDGNDNANGHGCEVSYRSYWLKESSMKCSEN